jgi:plasmid stabilization system protein ParE
VKTKPVVPRERASRDVDEAIEYYSSENAPQAALGFIDALERTYAYIARHPSAGSSRYAVELNLPGLRFWPVMSGACSTANGKFQRGCATPISLELYARLEAVHNVNVRTGRA